MDTPICKILPIKSFYKEIRGQEVSQAFAEEAKKITPRMVLSHTTGIPITGTPRFDFEPGTQFAYGNTALQYLQEAIAPKNGKSLDVLAEEEVFKPLKMNESSFLPPAKEGVKPEANAANSLHTTPSDFARLAQAWMAEKDCALVKMSVDPTSENQKGSPSSRYILTDTGFFYYNKRRDDIEEIKLDKAGAALADLHNRFAEATEDRPIDSLSTNQLKQITTITGHTNPLQEAFRPAISMTKDQMAQDRNVSAEDKEHLAWGLGLGLQLDDTGEVTTAFHSGDMNQWRGWFAMDLKEKSAVVYFANGNAEKNGSGHGYGHVLADVIIAPRIELQHGLDCFFKKWGMARNVEDGWKDREEAEVALIHEYVGSREKTKVEDIPLEHGASEAPQIALETTHANPLPLEVARDIRQRFSSTLQDARLGEAASAKAVEGAEVSEDYRSPSPFKNTPNP